MDFSFKKLILLVINVFLMITIGLMGPFIILLFVLIPRFVDIPIPMNKVSIQLYSWFNLLSGYQMYIPLVLMLLSLVFAFFVMKIMFKQKIKFNKYVFTVFFVNLVLLTFTLLTFLLQIEEMFHYYYSTYGDYVFGYLFAFIHFDFVLLVPFLVFFVSMFITATNIKLQKQIIINATLAAVCLVCVVTSFTIMQVKFVDLYMNISDIEGVDYKTKLPEKQYTLVTADGTLKHNKIKGVYDIPLNEHNAKLFYDKYFAKHYYNASASMLTYLTKYYLYHLNLDAIDNLNVDSYKQYPQHSLLEAALYSVALQNRISISRKSLKTFRSIYFDKSMRLSTECYCALSIIEYKLGELNKANKNCKPDFDSEFCDFCSAVLSGKIKNTTFIGQLVVDDKPVKDIDVVLLDNAKGYTDELRYASIIDKAKTDEEGKFKFQTQAKEPLALVILRDGIKNIVFDYAKLKDYKQGETVDLGKIILE